jgi:crotonobetainyl-CoA:carnitine CoA-transferase CaiB-like acyl-CoA transferase
MTKAPLEGIKVVEWTVYAQGPLSGVMLGELGADVIKIEDFAGGGDPARGMLNVVGVVDARMPGDRSAFFEIMNFNKRSLCLNLRHPQGRELARQLIDRADVFVVNQRIPTILKAGLDYETLRQRNPRLIYALATAYGERGPQAERGGVDYTGQARSGMMFGAGTEEDPPYYLTGGFADMGAAVLLSHAVITALLSRERHGVGQKLELSNLSAAMWMQYWAVGITLMTQRPWPRIDRRTAGHPLYNHYRCKDGQWLALASIRPEHWERFCQRVGLEHLLEDERFRDADRRRANARELIAILDEHFLTRTRQEWEELLLQEPPFVFERVQRIEDLQEDEQVLANEYVREMAHPRYGQVKVQAYPIRFYETPTRERRPAPEMGAHSLEVLTSELGLSEEQVAQLITDGIVA